MGERAVILLHIVDWGMGQRSIVLGQETGHKLAVSVILQIQGIPLNRREVVDFRLGECGGGPVEVSEAMASKAGRLTIPPGQVMPRFG